MSLALFFFIGLWAELPLRPIYAPRPSWHYMSNTERRQRWGRLQ